MCEKLFCYNIRLIKKIYTYILIKQIKYTFFVKKLIVIKKNRLFLLFYLNKVKTKTKPFSCSNITPIATSRKTILIVKALHCF